MRKIAVALALLSMLTAAGCAAAGAGTISLANRDFLSINVTDGGAARPLVDGTRIRLHFGTTDLGASAGCNSIGGTYRIEDGRLIFEGGSMTEMGCDPDRDAQDQWLIAFLGSRPVARLAGNDLTLESGSVVVTLRDSEVVEPDANIVGPTWTLTSIIQADAVSSVPDGQSATLKFGADGSLEVFAGCNRGSGTWKAIAGGIEVKDVVLTKMACDGPSALIESAVLGVLNAGTIQVAIDASLMTLTAGPNGLQYTAG
jgi:heat shock protein HslJ